MNIALNIAILMLAYFATILIIDSGNPCSQFGDHQERCSQRGD